MTKKNLPETSRATMETLETRRVEQERVVATLKSDQTSAILEGQSFDAARIRIAEDELGAIETAQATLAELQKQEAAREAAANEARTEEERRCGYASAIEKLESERVSAIQEMEKHARKMMAAYQVAESVRAKQHIAMMSQGMSSLSLMGNEQETRLSGRLSGLFWKVLGRGNFGQLKLYPNMTDSALDWTHGEKPVARDVEVLANELRAPVDNAEVA